MKIKIKMKIKNLYLIAAGLLLSAGVFAQAPQKMSYQTVIRNSSQGLVSSDTVGIKISILQGSSTGSAVYIETQTPTTRANGLASIELGGGMVLLGRFSNIDWANGPYFVKTEIDPSGGESYSIEGTIQLLSVPYAIYAKNGISTGQSDAIIDQTATIVALQAQMDILKNPQIYTAEVTVCNYSAVSGGNIIFSGLGDIIDRGVVWSTSPSPSIALNTKTSDGTGMGTFVSNLSGLTPNTNYYVRAYATNTAGTSYGNELIFTTQPIIGDFYQGGIVFYLDPSCQHGLIASTYDQAIAFCLQESFSNGIYFFNMPHGTTDTVIGSGNQNTINMFALNPQPGTAVEICANLSLNGYDDWFLPSINELKMMVTNIGVNSQFNTLNFRDGDTYWSSSGDWRYDGHFNSYYYYGQRVLEEYSNNPYYLDIYNPESSGRVRAVRAF